MYPKTSVSSKAFGGIFRSLILPCFLSFRLLMGVAEGVSAAEVSRLVNTTGVDLLLSDLLSTKSGGRMDCWIISIQSPINHCSLLLLHANVAYILNFT